MHLQIKDTSIADTLPYPARCHDQYSPLKGGGGGGGCYARSLLDKANRE